MSDNQKGKFFRFLEDLPPWARGLTIVGTLGVVTWVTVKIYSDIKAKKNTLAANSDAIKAQNDLNALAANGVQPSYVQTDYTGFVQTLVDAFNGCNIGTDAIKNVFSQMKNTADVLSLVTAFGVKSISPCWMNPYCVSCGTVGWIGYVVGANNGTQVSLPQAMIKASRGLGNSALVTDVNTILSGNNVNYQF